MGDPQVAAITPNGDHPGESSAAAPTGQALLSGPLADQAQLQGVLRQLFGLGLVVVSFTAAPPLDAVGEPNSV